MPRNSVRYKPWGTSIRNAMIRRLPALLRPVINMPQVEEYIPLPGADDMYVLDNNPHKAIDVSGERVKVVGVKDWAKSLKPETSISGYLCSLVPMLSWIRNYNSDWLAGDVIAGLTVGIVLIPQGMSYAVIATLPPQYGLYSSFVGVFVYCFFATSKDVSIGPVAVMSLTVAQIIKSINEIHPDTWSPPQIATTTAFLAGLTVLVLGLSRMGWLVEFIPAPAVSGFMTGSAISIVAGQLPALMGVTGFNTRAPPVEVVLNTLRGLGRAKMDAVFGLMGLFTLYFIKGLSARHTKHSPNGRLIFFLGLFRNALVLCLLTLFSFFVCHNGSPGNYPIKILQSVPRGFQHIGKPDIDPVLAKALIPHLPIATIILLLEHIAIAKAFGRVNGYRINPNQELIAIGVTNTVGSIFMAFPATGSFSRSALNSKSGVRSPAGGFVTTLVVLLALYVLTPAFYWIPQAGLSAVIIHAVADLVSSPAHIFSFWEISPIEFMIFIVGVLITLFYSMEGGIYTSIIASFLLLVLRIARPRGTFLGKVTLIQDPANPKAGREVFVSLDKIKGTVHNPNIAVTPPAPGVIIYRLEESYVYPNAALANSAIVDHVKATMRRGDGLGSGAMGRVDRLWNDDTPRTDGLDDVNARRPDLRAIVLDFSAVSQLDTTAVQAIIDTKAEVERWVNHHVEFHFCTVLDPWIRRALVAGGFGVGLAAANIPPEYASIVPEGGGVGSPSGASSSSNFSLDSRRSEYKSPPRRASDDQQPLLNDAEGEWVRVEDEVTPFFHFDLASAVRAAEGGAR